MSVTSTWVSWLSPEFSTATSKARSLACLDRVVLAARELLAARQDPDAGDPVAVEAARLGALGQALDDLRPERRGCASSGVLDEHRRRHGDVRDPLLLENQLGRPP